LTVVDYWKKKSLCTGKEHRSSVCVRKVNQDQLTLNVLTGKARNAEF